MTRRFLLMLFAFGLPAHSASAKQSAEPVPLFNGKNLDGWSGNPELWSVQDGVLVGTSAGHKLKANTFLVWKGGNVENFQLTFKAKLIGKNNSGVQYRSKLADEKAWKVVGYQCDIHPNPPYTAMLYSEGTGRGILAERGTQVVLTPDPKHKLVKKNAFQVSSVDLSNWHEYSISARGNHLVHTLDGETTVDVTDNHDQHAFKGVLALQLHRGPDMTVYFKDIVLETFGENSK